MSSIIPFTVARRATTSKGALDRLIADYARSHDSHEAPIVGCYQCWHNIPRQQRKLARAA